MPFASVDPATGRQLKSYQGHSAQEVEAKVCLAHQAFLEYRRTSFAQRAVLLSGVADLLDAEAPDMARIMTQEMGKTFAEAKGEVAKCARCLRYFAEHGAALGADETIATSAMTSYVHYQPLGPVLAVMPWNFPLWQVVRFAAPALSAGNVGLLKHAQNVPETALALEDLFRRAGFPEGVFTTLLVEVEAVADLIAHPKVAAVTLTGSERAGRAVAAAAGRWLKKSVLELGGSDPFVVLASADLERAVPTAVRARVQNNGQSCIAAKRFVVVDEVAEPFVDRFVQEMSALVLGDPMRPETDVGPLATEAQRDKVAAQVDDARTKGAKVLCGGRVPEGPGWYYPPTVVDQVSSDMAVAREEVFGPVAVIQRVADPEAALGAANDTGFGLGASVWTSDAHEARRFVEDLESGLVFVNAMVASNPELPFGGIKHSGYGRELSALGMKEFCNAKTVWEDQGVSKG